MSSVVNLKESMVSRFTGIVSRRPSQVGTRFGSALLAFAVAVALSLVGAGAAQADDGNPLTAAPIDATTRQGQPVSINLLGSGPAGDQLIYSLIGGFGAVATDNGTVSMDFTSGFPASRAIYTPNPGFSGTDTFAYRVSDSQFDSAPATVTVTVSPVAADNHPPVATPLSMTVENPGEVQALAAGSDVDGDVLTFAIANQPSHGSVTTFHDASGTLIVYDPTEDGYVGPDSFTYTASDGVLTSDPATVSVTVTAPRPNHVPTSVPPKVTTAQDTPVTFTATAEDLDGDPVEFDCYGDTLHGTVSYLGGGQFTYTPELGYSGQDSFHYDVTDFRSTSYSYAVNITVTPARVPAHTPSVRPFSVVTMGDPVAVTLLGSDPDGDALSYTTASGPSHGVLSGSGADLIYTPDASYVGQDSFTYQASDGHHVSTPAAVQIRVALASFPIDPVLDVSVSADQKQPSHKIVSPKFSTTGADRLVLAFISVDGPRSSSAGGAQRVSAVTGGNLSWTLVNRSNSTWGTAEVWQAHATSLIFGATVKAKFAKGGYDGSMTVAAFANTAGAVGASAVAAGKTGAAAVTVPVSGSAATQVWAVGHDWSRATSPVPLLDQELTHAFSDHHVGDTFWTERASFAYTESDVTIGLSAPTNDRWQLVAVTIPGIPPIALPPGLVQ